MNTPVLFKVVLVAIALIIILLYRILSQRQAKTAVTPSSINKQTFIETPILLKASTIGIIIIVGLSLISTIVAYPFMQDTIAMMRDPTFFETPTTEPIEKMFISLLPIIVLLSCFTLVLPGLIVGGLYARWHNQEKPTAPSAIKGAAATSAIAYSIGHTLVDFVGMFFIIPMQLQWMGIMLESAGTLPQASLIGTIGRSLILYAAISLVCNAIFQAVLGAGFGALGGLIGNSFSKNKPYDYAGGDVIG